MTTPQLLVVTDLDGTLLDEETYAFDAAGDALAALRERRIPLVLCSSKTRAELGPLARALGADGPWIVENGGAVVAPPSLTADGRWRRDADSSILELGWARARLVPALAEISRETGVALRGFADLTVEEVAGLTGLTIPAAALARQREYDEPFLVMDDDVPRVAAAAERRGLRIARGGRFHHLTGPTDKGRGVQEVKALYVSGGPVATVGLGDSANDLSLLSAVDRPIVVPRPGNRIDPDLGSHLPRAERAPAPGPAGWNAAVLAVLGGGRLPTVGGGPP